MRRACGNVAVQPGRTGGEPGLSDHLQPLHPVGVRRCPTGGVNGRHSTRGKIRNPEPLEEKKLNDIQMYLDAAQVEITGALKTRDIEIIRDHVNSAVSNLRQVVEALEELEET